MIVVIGPVTASLDGDRTVPAGLTAGVATTAASAGRDVEVVTRLGDDAAGDAVLLSLAAAGIGHVATLRDAAHATAVAVMVDEPVDPVSGPGAPGSATTDELAASTTRATTPALDPEDVGLALRYLDDYRVIVVVHPAHDEVVRATVAAAGYGGAHLVVVSAPGAPPLNGLPDDALALSAPDDADGVASLVGRYAAAVDEGVPPETAWASQAGVLGAG